MPRYDRHLIDYVPPYYAELLESSEILDAQNAEIARVNANIDELLAQFNVSTATWGLREWERICGITTDEGKALAERRSVINARLRGYGVVTRAHIENIAEAFEGGDVDVVERSADYTIVIKFVSSYGIPSNLSDLTDILREIIPAHLAIEYEFMFKTYDIIANEYTSYNDLLANFATYDNLLNGG